MIIIDEPNIPHKKKKDGDVSKANKKSKHKHIYDKIVLFEYQRSMTAARIWYTAAYYCSICGKIGNQVEGLLIYDWDRPKEAWLEKYPDATLVKLERGKRWYDIANINEVL
jgi:hypothetical protein